MQWTEILQQIFQIVILPLLGVLVGFLVKYIAKKTEELKVKTNNEILNQYIDIASKTVTECVIATNQTYVNALKAAGKFDLDAQAEAFQKTMDAVLAILNEDVIAFLNDFYGDLDIWLTNQIEAAVNQNKNNSSKENENEEQII